jgi:hypothetical protein
VRICKYQSDKFPIQNGLKEGDAVSQLPFNFALKYAIRRVQKNQEGLKLNGTHQLSAYANDIIIMGENIDKVEKNTEALLDSSKEVGLKANQDLTKYMLMLRSPKIGQKRSIKTVKTSFKDVAKFKYLGTTPTNRNFIREEMNSILNSGNPCYNSVQGLLSSCLLFRNVKFKIYKTIVLPVVYVWT